MAQKSKNRKKRKERRPKLRWYDKALYVLLLFLLYMVVHFCLLFFSESLPRLMFRQGDIIAVDATSVWQLWQLWLMVPFFGMGIWLLVRLEERKPLLGPKWNEDKHPRPKEKEKPEWRRRRALLMAVSALLYILLCIPAVGSMWAREEITPTEIRRYAPFGLETACTPLSQTDSVMVSIHGAGLHNRGWAVTLRINMKDGTAHIFSGHHPDVLLEINRHLPSAARTVRGAKNFDLLCDYYNATPEERIRWRELFRES